MYTYVKNNPLKYVDPSGHCSCMSGNNYNNPNSALFHAMTDFTMSSEFIGPIYPGPYVDKIPLEQQNGYLGQWQFNEQDMYIDQHGSKKISDTGVIPQNRTTENGVSVSQQPIIKDGLNVQYSWKPGMELTEQHIRDSMKNAPLQTQQKQVSLPAIQRYAERLAKGEEPPSIQVDGGVIIDGNHRYIAGRLLGIEVPQIEWSGKRPNEVINWDEVFIDPYDWGNK